MFPSRRELLRSAAVCGAAPLAGCAGTGDESTPPSATPNRTPEQTGTDAPTPTDREDVPTPVEEPSATVTVGAVSDDAGPVAFDVTAVDPVASVEAPPRLVVRATNGSDRRLGVGEARTMRFWMERGTATDSDRDHRLVLLPREDDEGIMYFDGEPEGRGSCWYLDVPVAETVEYRYETLEPGASIASVLEVWWEGPADACFPAGSFGFDVEYQVWDPDDDHAPIGGGDDFPVGFSVDVQRP